MVFAKLSVTIDTFVMPTDSDICQDLPLFRILFFKELFNHEPVTKLIFATLIVLLPHALQELNL